MTGFAQAIAQIMGNLEQLLPTTSSIRSPDCST